jgi:hypothetical protein
MAIGKKTGGRKAGTPNKASYGVRELASQYGPDALAELHRLSTNAESEQARVAACRAILDRAYGTSSSSQTINIDLPDIRKADDVVQAMNAAAKAVASGSITTAEARDLGGIFEVQRKAIETTELAERMARLEEAIRSPSRHLK